MNMLDELIGWLRLTVGSTAQRFRPHLRILSGATAVDNPAEESTDLTITGAIEQIGAHPDITPESHYPTRGTLDFVGMSAVDDEANDTLTLTVVPPDTEYTHGEGDITYYHDATLCELTVGREPGLYQINAYMTMCDRTQPTWCAYFEGIWAVRRDEYGTLAACSIGGLGGIPEAGSRYGNFNLTNILPYIVVNTDSVTFRANCGGLVPASVYDVACDARVMTFPESDPQ